MSEQEKTLEEWLKFKHGDKPLIVMSLEDYLKFQEFVKTGLFKPDSNLKLLYSSIENFKYGNTYVTILKPK